MLAYLSQHKRIVILPSLLILVSLFSVAASFIVDIELACAHSPHDVIDGLALSPAYGQDQTLFILTGEHLLRSSDGGFEWKRLVNGLDNAYILSSIAVSPAFERDRTVFVASKGDGVYKSEDGGDSWQKVDTGLASKSVGLLAISPAFDADQHLLAAGTIGGLYRSADGGASWTQVVDDEVVVTALAYSSDPERALIVIGTKDGRLWLSEDQGETWAEGQQLVTDGAITTLAISNRISTDGTFFVGTAQGMFKTMDGGTRFEALADEPSHYSLDRVGKHLKVHPPNQSISAVSLSPNYAEDGTVFASTWYEAVFESTDRGRSWQKHDSGISCDSQANTPAYHAPHFRSVGVSPAFAGDKTVFLAGFDGLFKSSDGGRNWSQVETLPVRIISGLGLSPAVGDDFAITITTYGGGAYTTHNQGTTWTVSNHGLQTTRLTDVTFSPAFGSDQTVFSGASQALLRSTDGAKDWDLIELDRIGSRGRPYPTFILLSPDFEHDQTLFFATRAHGILKSTDAGQTVKVIWDGNGKLINAFEMSPDFSADGTLFASVWGDGVYKTADTGQTWQAANQGLTFVDDWTSAGAAEIIDKNILLAVSPNYKEDKTLFAGSPGSEGLFKSSDGGASWQTLPGEAFGATGYIIGLGISPNYEQDETLLVSVKGKGLFKSEDGGSTFAQVGERLLEDNHQILMIAFSPLYATDRTIYAAYTEQIFRSTDAGRTWEMISRPVRYEDLREVIRFEGTWKQIEGVDYSATSMSQSSTADSRASLGFVGTGISWIGTAGSDQGIARVLIDGRPVGEADQFSRKPEIGVTSYAVTGLPYGWHTITIEVTDQKNPASSGQRITIDAFDVES